MYRDSWRVMAIAAVMVVGCDNDWRTDMWYQPAIRPQAHPRPEPEHSVPLGIGIHIEDRDEADDLHNPAPRTSASVERGRWLFEQRCAACHGRGHGGGPVSKFFPPAPDLAYATVKARSDGFIFATITLGGRAMPPQGAGLTERDRWDLVNYVRQVQAEPADGGAP
jgi:mono/diheme cytochrome c family protein